MGKNLVNLLEYKQEREVMKAKWNGRTIASSSNTKRLEGNEYFPPESVNPDHLKESSTQTKCAWKGTAFYYHLQVNGEVNKDAAWYYPHPSKAAAGIKDHIAFWKGVKVTND